MPFLNSWTLQRKIGFFVVLGLILGVGTFGFLSLQALRQSTQVMLQERLTTARIVANYTSEVLSRAMAELENTAQSISSDTKLSQMDSVIGALPGVYSRSGIFTYDILLVTASGKVVWSREGKTRSAGMEMTSYHSIAVTLTDRVSTISGLVSAPQTQNPLVLLSTPVEGDVVGGPGALVAAIDPARSSFSGFIQPIRLGATGYAEIVDQQGLVVARSQPGRPLAPFEQSDHPERFAALIRADRPDQGLCHSCHEQQITGRGVFAFYPLPSAQASWGVIIRQSEREALAATNDLKRRLLASGGLLIAMTLGVALLSTRNMVTRVKLLKGASQKMAKGDLTSAVPVQGRDEIGELAQSFDTMRLQLKNSYDQLEQRTRELASLLAISRALASSLDLENMLRAALDKSVDVIEVADAAVLLRYDPQHDSFSVACSTGLDSPSLAATAPTPGIRDATTTIIGQLSPEVEALARRGCQAFFASQAASQPQGSAVCAPVIRKGRFIGVLLLLSTRDSAILSDADSHIVQAVADEVAVAMENAELIKEAEQAGALREADRLKSQFISAISHELRTPLTSIKGYSTSLLRPDVIWDRETTREFLQAIDERADDLRDLIDKLLHMSRMESGTLRLEREPVLISHLARKVVDEMKARTQKHNFSLNFPSSFPVVEADSRHIELVLRNLVENAVKYSPRGGRITVQGWVDAGWVGVSVGDEGVGIASEHLDKIFDRFYRVYDTETKGIGGSGLGLSIAKGLLEAHGGSIWVQSTPGRGSTFFFSLPLEQGQSVDDDTEVEDTARVHYQVQKSQENP